MATGRGVQLEWAIVYESLSRADVEYSTLQERMNKYPNLKPYDGDIGRQARDAVDLVQRKNANLLSTAKHSDELGIKGDPDPKTDIVFTDRITKYNCSVKMRGPVQLSSAEGPSTAKALEQTAKYCPGERGKKLALIINRIAAAPTKLLTERNLPKATERRPNIVADLVDSRGQIKKDKNFDIWIANHKPKLIKDLYEYLKKDPVFLQCLIGEPLTGGNYFKNNKQAIATHMLSPTTFVEMDAKYAAAMVKKTKIDIRAKSRDGISSISFRFDVKA